MQIFLNFGPWLVESVDVKPWLQPQNFAVEVTFLKQLLFRNNFKLTEKQQEQGKYIEHPYILYLGSLVINILFHLFHYLHFFSPSLHIPSTVISFSELLDYNLLTS